MISSVLIFSAMHGWGQCKEWNWPVDKKTSEEKVALLQDAVNNKRYKQAIGPLNWLLAHAPQLNSSIYIHGATIYDELASRERNKDLAEKYADSLMIIYDQRMKHCGQRDYVLSRKALSAFKHYINGSHASRVLPLMDSVFSTDRRELIDGLLLPYMQTIVIVQSKFKTLSEDDILSRYERLVGVVDFKTEQARNDPRLQVKLKKTKKDIEEWLFKVVKPDCEFVKAKLAPRFRQHPTDTVLAKRIFVFMLEGKCIEDPLWLEAGELIFTNKSDYGLGKNLALRYLAMGNAEKANLYFDAALSLSTSRSDSSDIYYYKGTLEASRQDKVKARHFYLLAAKEETRQKDAFERIGDLYYGSYAECAKKESQANDRAIYLAAYMYYVKSGNQKKMAMAKQSFPSREEIFLMNYKVGDKIKINCWINEEVSIQTRD